MIDDPALLLIGSTARNTGKTTLAAELAKQLADFPLAALKVTRIADEGGGCPHGARGCGLCGRFGGGFCLERETDASGEKDTALLLASGIEYVYWLRAREEALTGGYRAFRSEVGRDRLTICESNSLRKYVRPLAFIMLKAEFLEIKPSARAVLKHADLVIPATHVFERRVGVFRDIRQAMFEKQSAKAL